MMPCSRGAFLQMPHSHLLGVATTMQHELQKHAPLLQGIISPSQRRAVASFIQAPQDYFDAKPTFKQSYAPQSGEIFGILTQMLETFQGNLAQSQKRKTKTRKHTRTSRRPKKQKLQLARNKSTKKTGELQKHIATGTSRQTVV